MDMEENDPSVQSILILGADHVYLRQVGRWKEGLGRDGRIQDDGIGVNPPTIRLARLKQREGIIQTLAIQSAQMVLSPAPEEQEIEDSSVCSNILP